LKKENDVPHLIAYAQLSTNKNSLAGNLVKAQCDFCGRKFGSLEEAKECEAEHLREFIRKPLQDELKKSIERNKQ
jgi:hypothetical protein